MESVSRYSIVERLTQEKLNIMDAKNRLDLEITEREQVLKEKQDDFEDWEKNKEIEKNREKSHLQKEINNARTKLETAIKRKQQNETHYDAKIAETDKALDAIRIISTSAPSPEQQK